jgi:hypothetical protein
MSKEHKHGVTSNTHECFQTFVGCRVKGFLKNALPNGGSRQGTKTLVFECGWGLTIASNGSFWVESPKDVSRAVSRVRSELLQSQRDIKDVLALAGEGV